MTDSKKPGTVPGAWIAIPAGLHCVLLVIGVVRVIWLTNTPPPEGIEPPTEEPEEAPSD